MAAMFFRHRSRAGIGFLRSVVGYLWSWIANSQLDFDSFQQDVIGLGLLLDSPNAGLVDGISATRRDFTVSIVCSGG